MLKSSRHLIALANLVVLASASAAEKRADRVIHISVDCLRPAVVEQLVRAGEAPNFKRLIAESAHTHNARADFSYTLTLPNHATQLTGRPVSGPDGHTWNQNSGYPPEQTLHTRKKSYVASVFDVVHDQGLRTGMFVTKAKMSFLSVSYDENHGNADTTGADNGKDKIDTNLFFDPKDKTDAGDNSDDLIAAFIPAMKENPYHYAFLHFAEPDNAAHGSGVSDAPDSGYIRAVKRVDGWLGQVFDLVESAPALKGKTVLLVTSDHGGVLGNSADTAHKDATNPQNYTVPFYVWGPGIGAGDLYAANPTNRKDPGTERPTPDGPASEQPIRNGEIANLTLQLLGLPPVPGSVIGTKQDLQFPAPGVAARALR